MEIIVRIEKPKSEIEVSLSYNNLIDKNFYIFVSTFSNPIACIFHI